MYVYTVLAKSTGGISTSLLFSDFFWQGKQKGPNIRSYTMYVYTALANPIGGISTSLLFSAVFFAGKAESTEHTVIHNVCIYGSGQPYRRHLHLPAVL